MSLFNTCSLYYINFKLTCCSTLWQLSWSFIDKIIRTMTTSLPKQWLILIDNILILKIYVYFIDLYFIILTVKIKLSWLKISPLISFRIVGCLKRWILLHSFAAYQYFLLGFVLKLQSFKWSFNDMTPLFHRMSNAQGD